MTRRVATKESETVAFKLEPKGKSMSQNSVATKLLNHLVAKKDPKGIAIAAIQKIQDSMSTSGGDSERSALLKSAAATRARGNTALADAMEKEAKSLPESKRGVSISEAMKLAQPHLEALGKTQEDVYSNGLGQTGAWLYTIGLTEKIPQGVDVEGRKVGDTFYQKPEKPTKPAAK